MIGQTTKSYDKEQANKKINKKSIFTSVVFVTLGAMVSCFLWGSAYPMIKLGYEEFEISSDMTATQILFAGIRFTLAGTDWVYNQKEAASAKEKQYPDDFETLDVSDRRPVYIFLCRTCTYYRGQGVNNTGDKCICRSGCSKHCFQTGEADSGKGRRMYNRFPGCTSCKSL